MMKFEFNPGTKIDTDKWMQTNANLKKDLIEIASTVLSEREVVAYVKDMTMALTRVGEDMLFLIYDKPETMPADARADFVYTPTYIAASIMMTVMCKYEVFQSDEIFRDTLYKVLTATMGRGFAGGGYDCEEGFMNTLEIYAIGNTLEFIERFPDFNEKFTTQLVEAITFLETSLCTGRVVEPWSGKSYSERANQVLEMFRDNE